MPNLSATELELRRRGRRRLIGAFTLGLLAIVFLPMLFDSEPKKGKAAMQEIAIQVPPKEGLKPLPAPVVPSPTPPKVETKAEVPTTTAPLPAPTATPALPATPTAATQGTVPAILPGKDMPKKPVVEPKLTPAPTPAAASASKQGFVVQIGAFKDAENAQQIVALMKESKLPVFTDSIATGSGSVTRVRVGPFATKEKADSALVQVKLAGADGKIVPLK